MPLWVRPQGNYGPLPPPPPTGWEETTILAAGLAPQNDDQLIRALIPINPVLAGRCLHEGQAQVDKTTRQAVLAALLETIARPEVALRVRIAAGQVLGYLGDPRLGAMVTIPAGEFWMGSDDGENNEEPMHKLHLPDYQISQYPVTNSEYAAFIEAGGYREKQWWTAAGWQEKTKQKWTEPRDWFDNRFNPPNRPVVSVSWYEAVAYCRWLSAATGRTYRLPSEAEWEKAARGGQDLTGLSNLPGLPVRRYPWGDDFDPSRLNAAAGEQQVETTTPVGIYPGGVSPYGLFDCAGNVWEWGATRWLKWNDPKPYPYDVTEDEWSETYLVGTNVRVLRGGSWSLNNPDDFRVSFRSRYFPNVGNFTGGFRLALSS